MALADLMKVVLNNAVKSVSLKYLLLYLFFSFTLNADDYVWGEEFEEGDIKFPQLHLIRSSILFRS